jgi:CheY-like chemotaxis protein
VIVAVLDDLMFTSKIRGTAAHAGVQVMFARSRDAAIDAVRISHPTLVLIDLDNPRTDPIGIVTAVKADPEQPGPSVVGFVSHVHTDIIQAARAAGADDVIARSAFSQRLLEILQRGR